MIVFGMPPVKNGLQRIVISTGQCNTHKKHVRNDGYGVAVEIESLIVRFLLNAWCALAGTNNHMRGSAMESAGIAGPSTPQLWRRRSVRVLDVDCQSLKMQHRPLSIPWITSRHFTAGSSSNSERQKPAAIWRSVTWSSSAHYFTFAMINGQYLDNSGNQTRKACLVTASSWKER